MKKSKVLFAGILGIMLLLFGLTLTSCDEEDLADIASMETYYFRNRSSYTVTVTAANGNSVVIAPGGNDSALYNRKITISDAVYRPANLVYPTLSGNTFTFWDY